MNSQPDDLLATRKIPVVSTENELDWAKGVYDAALKTMLAKPNAETISAFEAANKLYFETQDKYRIGVRLLLERALQQV